jgi:hypothetical protein
MVRAFLVLIIALALGGCGIPATAEMWLQTKSYSGDGTIHSCCTLFGAGYMIDFPAFSASRPFTASYRMAHVPKVFGSDPYLRLCFHWQREDDLTRSRSITANVRFTLLDGRGKQVRSLELPISSSMWGETGPDLVEVWDFNKGPIHFAAGEHYVLNVSYTPGSVPPPTKEAWLEIDNCATY